MLLGVATGAVTQAAVGVALNTSINVSDRPVTGQGVTGMKGGGAMQPGRLVEDGMFVPENFLHTSCVRIYIYIYILW